MSSHFNRVLTFVACFGASICTVASAQGSALQSVDASTSQVDGCTRNAPSPSILVTLPSLNALAFVDPSTQEIEQMDAIHQSPGSIVMHPRRPVAFIATNGNTQIIYFDLLCQRTIATIALPDGFRDMQINDDGTELFVLDNMTNDLLVISVAMQRVVQTDTLTSSGTAIAYSRAAHELFVPEPFIDRTGVLDTPSGAPDHVIFQGKCLGQCRPTGAETGPGGQYLFITDFNGGYAIYDAPTHHILVNTGHDGRVDYPILGGFDAFLNGIAFMYDVIPPDRVAVVSSVPPFQTLASWTIPSPKRFRLTSAAFDAAGIGYVAENLGLLLLYPDGSARILNLGTQAVGTAYYP